MYLSKIELFGFKSFANRVRISFDKGLTAIVGPNGCGKTNVVDAIRWVLGEQKSSLLRSAKMENIIFNGSRNLKPLSFTEVSLTIENTRNILPTQYTEVTVTRRIYRNGESDFLLNQVPCRLKDILDLFTDTGMGSDAYSVIELKMIEEIISNKSEERMKLFEEAAGITRYKQRRKQTFRQLESASRDLARVDDLLSEVEKKVRSLKLQVRKAEKLRELKTHRRELDLQLSWHTMESLQEKIEPLNRSIEQEELQNHELAARIATEDSAILEAERQQLEEDQALANLQKEVNRGNEEIHALEMQLLQLEEQQKNLTGRIERTETLATEKQDKILNQETLEKELETKLPEIENLSSKRQEEFQTLAAEHDQLNTTLGEQRSRLTLERTKSAERQQAVNRLAIERQALEAEQQHRENEQEKIRTKRQAAKARLETIASWKEESTRELRQKQEQLTHQREKETLLHKEREKLAAELEQLKERLLSLRSSHNQLHNQILFANSILENFEGMPEGIGFLEKHKDGRPGIGCLSDHLSLDDSARKAVNAALGESMNYYVCRTLEEAHRGIAALRSSAKGKVSFLVLDLVPPPPPKSGPDIPGAQKTIELLSAPPELHDALAMLLWGSYTVPTAETAEKLAFHHPDLSMVTREGEKFTAKGLLLAGSPKSSEGLRLGKKTELDSLEKKLKAMESTISGEEMRTAELEHTLRELKTGSLQPAIRETETTIIGLEKKLALLEAEEQGLNTQILSGETEAVELKHAADQCTEKLLVLLGAITEESSGNEGFQEEITTLQANLSGLETRHHELGKEVQQRQSSYRDALQELDKLRIAIENCRIARTALHEEITTLHTEAASAAENLTLCNEAAATLKKELETRRIRAAEHQKKLNEKESRYHQQQAQQQDARNTVREMNRKLDVGRQLQTALATERSTMHQELERIFTSIKLKYNCELATMERPIKEEPFNFNEATETLASLEAQCDQFGAVNELALDEYQAEKERLDFLTEQKNDLYAAETQLRETIEEINRTALEKFEATFHAVRKNFTTIFQELFDPEDEADLLIHTADDPLESHIEIVAKPKGKKPLSIEQLSGGEKALTALSLLFSIYLVKPSPFCILDEVDAPLDDGNVGRFIKLLKKFENNTQFIIVTHNKNTMASCQALYGVTMEEEGVSKLIPVRLEKIRH
ncbi:MAG TPA: chromosome segregation protein SMC [Chlorobium sp.]|uniref:Chromosome partition protein Smc n=1 Tax=Chlorobium phaeovibrioides (strain DSM 265 / 1930) TaxID=290318 RepID=A4SG64_CHLPM|nr:chromosome segregation protein SMC [Chlorobium sp.]